MKKTQILSLSFFYNFLLGLVFGYLLGAEIDLGMGIVYWISWLIFLIAHSKVINFFCKALAPTK